MNFPSASTAPAPPRAGPRMTIVLIGLVYLASFTLYARPLLQAALLQDDFQILDQSWTWARTRAALWQPHNEHFMPLGRLLTCGLVWIGGPITHMPFVCALLGPLALWSGMGLLYVFVRRELGSPLYALLAMTLFGVSCIYQQAIWWFAASFSVLAMDTLLLGLLAAQRWKQTSRIRYLLLSAMASFLAPSWFASGVLVGPFCAVYLFPQHLRAGGRAVLALAIPLAGTALALFIIVTTSAEQIQHLEHYQGHTATEAFDLSTGLADTARSLVDNLLPGLIGVGALEWTAPWPVVAVVLLTLGVLAGWWWRQAPRPQLLRLGTALVLCSYVLTYSVRALWPYEELMTTATWTRYHLLPQLGLTLFVVGGLPGRAGKWFLPAESLSRAQVRVLGLMIALGCLLQLPRGLFTYFGPDSQQQALLQLIEQTEERCRRYHIDGEAARQALPKLSLESWASDVNGWSFLRGSDRPQPHRPEEIRQLLQD